MTQTRYIFEGILMILVFLIVIRSIYFISSTEIVKSEHEEEHITTTEVASKLPPTYNSGRILFMNNCATCHAVRKNLTGPGLGSITSRVADKELLFAWIRNNQKVLKSGNAYFNDLYKAYNRLPMPTFPTLSDQDIQSILDYIKAEENSGSVPAFATR